MTCEQCIHNAVCYRRNYVTSDYANRCSDYLSDGVIDDIKAEILEETECHYGNKCLGANCPSNTDCMIMGEHVIEIIDRHTRKEQSE